MSLFHSFIHCICVQLSYSKHQNKKIFKLALKQL